MNQSRTLLVPIDFSIASKVAVKFALTNEYKKSDKLILLHTYRLIADDYASYRDSPRELKKMLEKQLSEQYEKFSDSLKLAAYGSSIEFRMEVGFMVNCIHSICQKTTIDLIVFGVKSKKDSHAIVDLIAGGCAPVRLVAENLNMKEYSASATKAKTSSEFSGQAIHYLNDMQDHPNLTYLVRG